jgi:ATP-dependent DNA ligase
MPYQNRREKLLSMFGEPQDLPFQGISPAREYVLTGPGAVDELLKETAVTRALLERDPMSPYIPGIVSERDFIIRAEHRLAAIIVRVSWSRGENGTTAGRYQVALRNKDKLVPVGWASRGLSEKDQLVVSHSMRSLVRDEDESEANAKAQILLNLKIRGAIKRGNDFCILGPIIEGFRLNASPMDADELDRLEKILH